MRFTIKPIKMGYPENAVVSMGIFAGHFFYFRARQNMAIIQFSKTEYDWHTDNIARSFVLTKTEWPYKGWYPIWRCYLLIFYGCVKFLIKRK